VIDEQARELAGSTVERILTERLGGPSSDLWTRLVEHGWLELRADDEAVAVEMLFERQGALPADASPALDLAVTAALTDALGSGTLDPATRRVHVVYPAVEEVAIGPVTGRWEPGGRVDVSGLALPGIEVARSADDLIVTGVRDEEQTSLVVVAASQTQLDVIPVQGIDPALGLHRVHLRAPGDSILAGTELAWQQAVDTGRRALSHELLGAAQAALDAASAHAGERQQFGRPIGAFQAVRHHLADVYVAIESARLAVAESWISRDSEQTALAKAMAGEAHAVAARWCLQVFGAIGFTWEQGLHRWLRRGWALDSLLGSAAGLTAALGTQFVDERRLPRFGELARDAQRQGGIGGALLL
jgi:hypothetical protein